VEVWNEIWKIFLLWNGKNLKYGMWKNRLPFHTSNHSEEEAIPLRALLKDTTSEIAVLSSTLTLFYAERQAGKL